MDHKMSLPTEPEIMEIIDRRNKSLGMNMPKEICHTMESKPINAGKQLFNNPQP